MTAADASAASPTAALSWQDCIRLAAQNNPDLLSSLSSLAASRADYWGSYNGILPQVSLSNSYSESGRAGVWSAQANASLELINFGQWASIQSSLATYNQSQARLRVSSSNTLLDLYRAFTGLLYAQEAIQVNAGILESWRTNAQMVNLRYQSGRESKGNNMNTQAQSRQAKADFEQSQRDLRVAQQTLSVTLGRDGFSPLVVFGSWSASPVPDPRPNFDALLLNVPQIQVQEAAVEQARAAIKSAHSTLWPSLSLNYTRGAAGPTEFPQNPFWAMGGSVNYPLFAGGPTATYYASQSAQRSYDQARFTLKSTKNQALTDLESTWSSFAAADDNVHVQKAFLDAALQRKKESDIRYQSGLMTFNDWIIVIQAYVALEQNYLKAQQNLILAEAQWRFAKGDPL